MKTIRFINCFVIVFINVSLITILHAHGNKNGLSNNTLRFEHLTIEDGLSYPNVYGIFQDHRGFLWFATKYGLNKYDGMDFTVYTHDSENYSSLSHNFTWNLFEDSLKNLWIVTYGGGLDIFDPATETFKHYKHDPENPNSLSSDYVWCIFEDSQKKLWIGTDDGLNLFNPKSQIFTHFKHHPDDPNSLSHNIVTMIIEDKQHFLWIGTYGGGLNKFDMRNQRFVHYQHQLDNSHSLSNDKVNCVYIDHYNMLWIATGKGLNKYDLSSQNDKELNNFFIHYFNKPDDPHSLSNNRVRSIYEDNKGTLWFATSGGLNQYNRKENNFISFQSEYNNPNSLSHDSLYFVTGDNTNTLWIGTANGVEKLDPGNQQFELYLSGFHIHSVYECANGVLEIGTSSGLKRIFDSNTDHNTPYDNFPLSIRKMIVTKILSDKDGMLWIATQGEGLNKCDPKTGKCLNFRKNPVDSNSLYNNTLLDIAISPYGKIWIALTDSGIDSFDPKRNIFKHYNHDNNDPNSLISNWTRSILIDSKKRVWIGTEGGISRFNPDDETFTNYLPKKNNKGTLNSSIINMIFEDSKKNIWVATNAGLHRFNPLSNRFTIYLSKNGLPGNSISAILEDQSGYLWVSTNNGLSKFDPIQNSFKNYDYLDGLQGKQFIYHSAWKSNNGKLYFGGTKGLNAFFPETLSHNTTIPPVYFTDFRLFNQSVPIGGDSPLKQHISITRQITLTHRQSVFSIDFVALNYRASKKNQYAYMLEGFDKEWTYTDSKHRTARYTNLNPGHYIFRVKASNNDGLWNDKGISLNIAILPAWWMTWWFKALLFLCFIGSGFGIYYWRLRVIMYRNITLEKLVEERTFALKVSEGRYQELFDTINSGVAVFEAVNDGNDFIIREFNRAGEKIEGVNRSEILGKKLTQSFPGTIESNILSMLKDVWHHGKMKYFSPVLYQDARGESWRENYVYKLPSGEVVSVYNDVTDRVNKEKELRYAQKRAEISDKAKSQFLAHMSHELRTPLNGILGYSQILKQNTNLTTEQMQGLVVIHKSGEHLLTLINDILDLSTIEAGKLKLYPRPIVLLDLLKSVIAVIRMTALKKGIQFIFEPSKNLPVVINTDAKRLRQILLNLLGNAVKFTDKGSVTLHIEQKKSHKSQIVLHFEIKDTGVGIAPDQLSEIFKPFEQAGDTEKKHQGTGLGLTISRQLVDLMGGVIQVESEHGKGATFLFDIYLPEVNQTEIEKQHLKNKKIIAISSNKNMKILIVDDIEDNRKVLFNILAPLGFEIFQAVDGQDGVKQAKKILPDLILMDLIMPVMDGLKAVQEIRKITELKRTVIFAVSASVIEKDKNNSYDAGCNAFLPKPIKIEELFDLMEKYLPVEWIYEKTDISKIESQEFESMTNTSEMIPPPHQELIKLYDLARYGSMDLIQKHAGYLEKLDNKYLPFAQKIRNLSSEFEDELILSMVKQFMGDN